MSDEKEEYLVRGALLYCKKGSHPRRLNLPQCHGIYVMGHPVIQEMDCVPVENISYFGVCQADTPPEGAEEVLMDVYVPQGEESTGEEIQGPRCSPDIVGKWRSIHAPTKIKGEEQAVTTQSYLVCNCGGIIEPLTSGQEYEDEESSKGE